MRVVGIWRINYCSNNCSECPRFNYLISKENLKHHILSDLWFKNLLVFIWNLFNGRRLSCSEKLNNRDFHIEI